MADSQTEEREDTSPDFPAVAVSGDFVDRVQVIRGTNLSTVLTLGTVDDRDLLLPFVDWSFDTPEGIESKLLTFENVAYILAKLAGDYSRVCGEIERFSTGGIGPETGRMKYAHDRVADAIDSLAKARHALVSTIEK